MGHTLVQCSASWDTLWFSAVHHGTHSGSVQCIMGHTLVQCSASWDTLWFSAVHHGTHSGSVQCIMGHTLVQCSASWDTLWFSAVHHWTHFGSVQCNIGHTLVQCSASWDTSGLLQCIMGHTPDYIAVHHGKYSDSVQSIMGHLVPVMQKARTLLPVIRRSVKSKRKSEGQQKCVILSGSPGVTLWTLRIRAGLSCPDMD